MSADRWRQPKVEIRNVVVFVTGGASGIGRSVSRGGKAVIVDLNDNGQKLADGLGKSAAFIKADVTSEEDVKRALKHTRQQFGGVNVVMNWAGIVALDVPYDFKTKTAYPLEIYKKLMDVNALGTFNVTRLTAGVMAENVPGESQQRGVIINVASIAAEDSSDAFLAYAASKAAVRGMTILFARCFTEKGIRVVTISPGYTSSPVSHNYESDPVSFSFVTESCLLTPKRFATADEVAHLAQCVIEDSYINAVDTKIQLV